MTRGRVGILNPDGTVRSIYVACDGYVNGLGKNLLEHYKTTQKINELMDLNAVQGVHKDIITMVERNIKYEYDYKNGYIFCENIEDFIHYEGMRHSEDYLYIFKDNDWYCFYLNCEEIEPTLVSELLKDPTID